MYTLIMNKPIGIFDSGLGGLTILRGLEKAMPSENFIYFGDTAHVPYGSKSPQTVTNYSLQIAKFLEKQNIKFLVVACNTASALALDTLVKNIKVPVFGVIEAGCCAAVHKTKNKKIAVIGTHGTVKSSAYKKLLNVIDKNIKVAQIACPLFVPVIEEGWHKTKAAEIIARAYLDTVKKSGADTLILGCTHYPIMKPLIKKIMGSVHLIDSAEEIAKQVKKVLQSKNILKKTGASNTVFYVSDDAESFEQKAAQILGRKTGKVNLKKL